MARRQNGQDGTPGEKQGVRTSRNGANLGFGAQFFLRADKLHKNLQSRDYEHLALGLIFLRCISDAFETQLGGMADEPNEGPDEYPGQNIFWVFPSRSLANSSTPPKTIIPS